MGSEWAVVVAGAVGGVFALLGTAVTQIASAIRDRGERRRKTLRTKSDAFDRLRRGYVAAHPYLDGPEDNTWINIVAAAADCIPYTGTGSEARGVLVQIIGRERVEVDMLIAALSDEPPR